MLGSIFLYFYIEIDCTPHLVKKGSPALVVLAVNVRDETETVLKVANEDAGICSMAGK